MIRILIGFVTGFSAGYSVAKTIDFTETGKKIKNIFLKYKDAVKEEDQEKRVEEEGS